METPDELREKAARYRKMLHQVHDQQLTQALTTLAEEYDALAAKLDGDNRRLES